MICQHDYLLNQHDCPKRWHSFVHFKSDDKHLHRPVHLNLHPHLTSSLYTFEACGKSVHNGIISISTFCQPHWQAFRLSKSLSKGYCSFLKIEGLFWGHVVLVLLWQVRCSRSLCYLWKTESLYHFLTSDNLRYAEITALASKFSSI